MLGILKNSSVVVFVAITALLITFSSSSSLAHRNSDADIMAECKWNKKYLSSHSKLEADCNDLYHLYRPKSLPSLKSASNLKLGSFNLYILAGRNRNKEFPILSRIFNDYDVMAVSELQHSTTEELKSNINLSKNSSLDYEKYYHAPGYLRLLEELRKEDSSWSLILSPAAQSESEELLGFYYKANKVQLDKSEYCEEYNRDLRDKKALHFAGGIKNSAHGRAPVSPYLKNSFGCSLNIKKDENNISRIPFSARFKTKSGFDFQFLSYHARYDAPIAVGRTCGFECLELTGEFYNSFHKEGAYLGTLDYTALRLLNGHINYISLKSSNSDRGLFEGFSALTKLKYGKPRIYDNVIRIRDFFKEQIPIVLEEVWRNKYNTKISRTNRDKVNKYLLSIYSSPEDHEDFKDYIKEEGSLYKDFISDIFNEEPFASISYRLDIWQDPADISRFHAIQLIVDQMEEISSKERDTDVLLGGDLNLEVTDKNFYYWNFLKKKYDFADVFIDQPTSIGNKGIANAYDHFLLDDGKSFQECKMNSFDVTNFVKDKSWWKGFEYYFVDSRADIEKVSKKAFDAFKELNFVGTKGEIIPADEYNVRSGYRDCFDKKTYKDQSLAKIWQKKLECQTLKFYLDGDEPYRLFKDIVSDHMPVSLTCDGNSNRD